MQILFLLLLNITLLLGTVNRVQKVEIVKNELHLHFANNYNKKNTRSFTLTNPFRRVFEIKNSRLLDRDVSAKWNKSLKVLQYKPNVIRVIISSKKPFSSIAYSPLFSKNLFAIPLPRIDSVLPIEQIHKYKEVSKRSTKTPTYRVSKKFRNIHRNEPIVIDAGHGGADSGAVGGGKKEKHLVLQIAKRVRDELRRRGFPVYMTRDKDYFLKLSQRTKIADKRKAVAFISIHANAVSRRSRRNKVEGIETYFLQNTRDARSQRIASIENKAVLKGTNKLSRKVIIDSVLSGPKIVESNKLAIDIQRKMMKNIHTKYKRVRDGGVRSAPFYVLVGASRPSILVEVGYISHPRERKRLFTTRYQKLIAKGIAEGVESYMKNRRREIDFF
ncbi:MAG: N-acetylmuramoyl-L-alanine amidase [Sulfurovum sp.]